MKKELFILPFDHRSSFIKNVLKIKRKPNKKEKETISHLKETIFLGFLDFVKNKNNFGILVDEEYGKNIIERAKEEKTIVSISVEKSGKQQFEFEYGNKFKKHINKFKPDYVKLLVRYNLKEDNTKQLNNFKRLNSFCKNNDYKIIFELLIKNKSQASKIIEEIKQVIQPDIWKLEGDNNWNKVIKSINENSQIIMLGRGENIKMVEKWIKNAKPFKKIVGFAIGRTIFMNSIKNYYNKKIPREIAIKEISDNFKYFVNFWKSN